MQKMHKITHDRHTLMTVFASTCRYPAVEYIGAVDVQDLVDLKGGKVYIACIVQYSWCI